ncbi:MAG: class I SAM-dependent methyltransferase [Acidobacteria bacterium]|nr:class I SAM-dependent methyltransferase [Acidobacteriota bacterium]
MNRTVRRQLMRLNNFVGRQTGAKLQKVPYSRPSTLRAKAMFGDRPIRILEIGCAAGNNALDVLSRLPVREYVVVDPYEHAASDYADYNRERLALMRRQAKARLQAFDDKIVWVYEESLKAATTVTGPFDMIYVDGDHSYRAVLADMEAYFSLLADRCVFGGHDIDQPEVARAFVEFVSAHGLTSFEIKDPDWIIFRE